MVEADGAEEGATVKPFLFFVDIIFHANGADILCLEVLQYRDGEFIVA